MIESDSGAEGQAPAKACIFTRVIRCLKFENLEGPRCSLALPICDEFLSVAVYAVAIGVVSVGLALVGGGEAYALSAGCAAINGFTTGSAFYGPYYSLTTQPLDAGETVTLTASSADATWEFSTGTQDSIPSSPKYPVSVGAVNVTFTIPSGGVSAFGIFDTNYTGPGTMTNLSITCTGVATGTPSDSTNLRSLQNGITKSAATISGQVVSTAVNGAIDDAFSGGGAPLGFSPNGVSINFAAAPNSDVNRRIDTAFGALAYADTSTEAPHEFAPYRDWSAWLDLRGTGWQNDDTNVGATGGQFNLTGGIGRKLTPNLLIGVYSGYEYFKYDVRSVAGSMKGTGGSIGGYLGWRMRPTLRFDAMLGYTRMAYSGTAGTASGSFNGNRLLLSSGLTGSYGLGALQDRAVGQHLCAVGRARRVDRQSRHRRVEAQLLDRTHQPWRSAEQVSCLRHGDAHAVCRILRRLVFLG